MTPAAQVTRHAPAYGSSRLRLGHLDLDIHPVRDGRHDAEVEDGTGGESLTLKVYVAHPRPPALEQVDALQRPPQVLRGRLEPERPLVGEIVRRAHRCRPAGAM